MKRLKQIILVMMAALLFMFSAVPVQNSVHAQSIKERIQGSQGSEVSNLEKKVDDSTSAGVSMARRIFVTFTVIFGLWLAICYFRAGFSPDSLRETKGKILFFILFLILSFWTEDIIGAAFKLFGIDLSKL
ncbi:hypothetical protein [Paenibacillus apis]|uniref:Uncharacterized protein n=1 Tax=Paenibacillus apis TaxID=1792174 RepID=A0A919XZT6_9BACL|nr:hypothetical protein [Paenibacillus apis]GIO42306.1 hypothetical protein J41TS4_20640 [Paenibacillus apis]